MIAFVIQKATSVQRFAFAYCFPDVAQVVRNPNKNIFLLLHFMVLWNVN